MQSPTLNQLPPPPRGKSGWPWTEASPQIADFHNRGLPRVSIVTPSYNQAAFLEETIRSVLLQGYPNLEYIINDGGSTDGSVEIIRKYEPWLAHWVSERDGGQSDAINKGFAQATGAVTGWLNSDDVYAPGALQTIGEYFAEHPSCELVYGNGWYIDVNGKKTEPCSWISPFDRKRLLTFNFILQPAAFWRRSLWERTGGLNIAYHWAMDWDWLIRATALAVPQYLRVELANWRITPEIKTNSGGKARRAEIAAICKRYGGVFQPTFLLYHLELLGMWIADRLGDGAAKRIYKKLVTPVRWALKEKLWKGRLLS